MNLVKRIVVTVTLCGVLGVSAVGCNTMKGLGEDIERGGEKLQGAAEKNKND